MRRNEKKKMRRSGEVDMIKYKRNKSDSGLARQVAEIA